MHLNSSLQISSLRASLLVGGCLSSLSCVALAAPANKVTSLPVGANLPFTTFEAEQTGNTTNGTVVRMTPEASANGWTPTPELEASNSGYVELKATGEYVDFPKVPASNVLVIRHCIPDAPEGGGIEATLGLYVNGIRRQDLTLSSKHNWLYSDGKPNANGQSNTPTEFSHVFWEESRFFIKGGVKAGDTIRLQKDAGDTAAFYRIDLIEPEFVGPPLKRPENSLSVADYGAQGESAAVDTPAMQRCIDEAKAQKKTVWFPAGKYLQNQFLKLDGVQVQGAGQWYTTLYDTVGDAAKTWSANSGFQMNGDGSSVSDLSIDSLACTARANSPKAFFGYATNWSVQRVWVQHMGVGVWMAGDDGLVKDCRVHFTYADGININNGKIFATNRVLVENNHVRGTGDDGLAILSQSVSPHPTEAVTLRHNTVIAPWFALNCDLAGGSKHVIEDNYFEGHGFGINLPGAYPMNALTDSVFRRNTLMRCGSNYARQRRGAIWIYPGTSPISVLIEDNRIIEPLYRGIHSVGYKAQDITVRGNLIQHPGQDAIVIEANALGTGQFESNTVTGLNAGFSPLVNAAKEKFPVTQTANSWQ